MNDANPKRKPVVTMSLVFEPQWVISTAERKRWRRCVAAEVLNHLGFSSRFIADALSVGQSTVRRMLNPRDPAHRILRNEPANQAGSEVKTAHRAPVLVDREIERVTWELRARDNKRSQGRNPRQKPDAEL